MPSETDRGVWSGLFNRPDPDLQLVSPIHPQRLLRYRAGAAVIDVVLSLFLGIVLAIFLNRLLATAGIVHGEPASAQILVWTVAMATIYYILLESVLGTTLGKRVFGLRVVSADGTIHTVPQTVIRNLFRPLDQLFFIGVFLVPGSTSQQRLGDVAASTLVGRASKPSEQIHDPPHRHPHNEEVVIVPGREQSEWTSRAVAGCIDVLPAFVVGLFTSAIVLISVEGIVATVAPGASGQIATESGTSLSPVTVNLLVLTMMAVYHPLLEATWGTTLGRRLMGLRVATSDGTAPNEWQLFVRNVLRPIDYLLCPVTALSLAVSRQRLSDRVAGTVAGRPSSGSPAERPHPDSQSTATETPES